MGRYALSFGGLSKGGRSGFKNKDELLSFLIQEHSQFIEKQIVIIFPDGTSMRTLEWD
jgi:hypothetical protein